MVSIETLLFSSADEALSTVGEPTRQTFLRHLEHDGVAFGPDKVDLEALETKLADFFGVGSPVIIDKIYEVFMRKAHAAGYVSVDTFSKIDDMCESANLE